MQLRSLVFVSIMAAALGMSGCDDSVENEQPDGGGEAMTCEEAAGVLTDCLRDYCASASAESPFCACYIGAAYGIDVDTCQCSNASPENLFRTDCAETGDLGGLDGPDACDIYAGVARDADLDCSY